MIVALVNVESSPLAQAADYAIPLCAGREQSVAATKSYIAALAAIIHLVALLGARTKSCWMRSTQAPAAARARLEAGLAGRGCTSAHRLATCTWSARAGARDCAGSRVEVEGDLRACMPKR